VNEQVTISRSIANEPAGHEKDTRRLSSVGAGVHPRVPASRRVETQFRVLGPGNAGCPLTAGQDPSALGPGCRPAGPGRNPSRWTATIPIMAIERRRFSSSDSRSTKSNISSLQRRCKWPVRLNYRRVILEPMG